MGCEFSRIMDWIRFTSLHYSILTRVTPSVLSNQTAPARNAPPPRYWSADGMKDGRPKFSRARQRHRQYQLVGQIFPTAAGLASQRFTSFINCAATTSALTRFSPTTKKRSVIFSLSTSSETVLPGPVARQVMNILFMQGENPRQCSDFTLSNMARHTSGRTSPRICTCSGARQVARRERRHGRDFRCHHAASGRIKTVT